MFSHSSVLSFVYKESMTSLAFRFQVCYFCTSYSNTSLSYIGSQPIITLDHPTQQVLTLMLIIWAEDYQNSMS
jgi:hypothetical protein